MERGPLPIAALPMSMFKYQNSNSVGNYDDESGSTDGDVSYGGLEVKRNKLKSINNIVRGDLGMISNNSSSTRNMNRLSMHRYCGSGSLISLNGVRNTLTEKRNIHFENDESREDEEEEAREGGEERVRELTAEVRGFAERFMRMENRKIEMIVESQRKMVDTIGRAFRPHKKVKMTKEI